MTGKALRSSGILAVAALGATFATATPAESDSTTERAKVVSSKDGISVDAGGLDVVPRSRSGRNLGGPSTGFTQSAKSQLPSGSMRDFALIDASGDVRDVVIDRTITSGSNGKSRVGWVRTSDSIGIEWPQRGDISHWDITSPDGSSTRVRNNESTFVDSSEPESGTYMISGDSADDGDDVSFILTIPDTSTSPVMKAESGTSATSSAPDRADGQWRGIAWDSFIEEDFVEGEYLGIDVCRERDEYIYYGGDGRGFADSIEETNFSGDPSFRLGSGVASMFSFTDGWVNPRIYDNLVAKQTGETTAYDADKELIKTAQADAEEAVTLTDGDSTVLPPRLGDIGYATREVEMEASDPLCTPRVIGDVISEPPPINVEYTYEHTSNGYVHVEATHDKAPMHELFWGASDSEAEPNKRNGCLYRYENRGLEKLSPIYGRVDVTVDYNPDERTPDCMLDEE